MNAFALLVPLAAVLLLRLYDNHLVRHTEQSLLAESVALGEAYREAWLRASGLDPSAPPDPRPPGAADPDFQPVEALLDVHDGVLPPTPDLLRTRPPRPGPELEAGRALGPLLARVKHRNLSSVRVLDREGCVVATSGGDDGACLDELPEVRAALAGQQAAALRERRSDDPPPSIESISRRGRVRVYVALPVFSGGEVIAVVRTSRTALDPGKALYRDRGLLLAALLLSLALTFAVSLLLSRGIARPLQRLAARAQQLAAGGAWQEPEPGPRPREIAELEGALQRMTAQLTARAAYVERFAANASHELKTPITSIRGAAELLREGWAEMNVEERERFLDHVLQDAARMDRLVRGLLALARLENVPEAAGALALREALQALCERHPGRVQLCWEDAPATISIPREQLEQAVGNLLDNAVRHGGEAPVVLTARAAGEGRVQLCVQDRGPGISEGNRARIFERFFTTERARGGTGLGLPIVRAIAQARGGSVRFETGPSGTSFFLEL